MRALAFCAVMAFAVHGPAHAGESLFTLSEELKTDDVQELLDPKVAIFWGDDMPPAGLMDKTRPDLFSGVSTNIIPFAGSAGNCRAAFRKSLKNMLDDAHKMGYDVIYGVKSLVNGTPTGDLQRFTCAQMVHVSSVKFRATLARTPAAAQRFAEAEAMAVKEASASARKPADKSSYLPLQPILNSPEAQAILGANIQWHVGAAAAPAYNFQLGPLEYEGKVKSGDCKKAVLDALTSMVDDAKDKGYSALTRIHSYADEMRTPAGSDVECEVSGSTARVTLRTVLGSVN